MSLTVRLPRRRRQEGLKRARFRGTPSETPRHAEESLVVCPLAIDDNEIMHLKHNSIFPVCASVSIDLVDTPRKLADIRVGDGQAVVCSFYPGPITYR
jgi:hypothetical protein